MDNVRPLNPRDLADEDGLNRTPPGDPEAERALLARCIHHPEEYTAAADIITAEDFTQPGHRLIWEVIGHQLAENKPVDPITLRAAIDNLGQLRAVAGGNLLFEVSNAVGPTDAETYADIVHAKTRLRRIDNLAVRLRSGVLNGGTLDELEEHITSFVKDRSDTHSTGASRFVPGGSFILDRPDTVPAIWGEGDNVLWAEGEALIIAGPPGVGKTTVGQQVLLAAIGIRPHALGLAVRPAKRVLYLASDRPQQAARSMARMVTDEHRNILNQHLTFWPGPPPADFIKDPGVLLRLARQADADVVCLDSLKDMAGELASEEGGQAINSAIQRTLVEGIEVLALHHHRKQGGGKDGGKEPTSLDELYGSTWITAGAGSVVSLWGSAGDPIVSLKHLKQPAAECGPWRLKHDHPQGVTEIWHEVDVLDILAHAKGTLTAHQLACQIYSPDKGKPSASEVEKARRKLDQLVEKGLAHKIVNGGGRGSQTGYVAAFSPSGEVAEGA
ncbi:DnaB-like helicase N-terminal domain-containing protein [Streptomyces sp. L2]|uniref:DnaB-like helicase N-terminal domain-containing protein n=1 Tax=Streptomyces sp. L2 TaxID=2162665 RepID=UPI001011D6A2|nr:DnaB-like helicase N-terminal domain-containing protein [Streptomyces sp. L2]